MPQNFVGPQKRAVPSLGYRPTKKTGLKAGVIFDDEMFMQIRDRAVKYGTTFSEQVRLLCEWGLEAEQH